MTMISFWMHHRISSSRFCLIMTKRQLKLSGKILSSQWLKCKSVRPQQPNNNNYQTCSCSKKGVTTSSISLKRNREVVPRQHKSLLVEIWSSLRSLLQQPEVPIRPKKSSQGLLKLWKLRRTQQQHPVLWKLTSTISSLTQMTYQELLRMLWLNNRQQPTWFSRNR